MYNIRSIFFSALAQGLEVAHGQRSGPAENKVWTTALESALNKLYTYTLARPPSRTLVDPLSAFTVQVTSNSALGPAVQAAQEAAEATKNIAAKAGRSAYVEGDRLRDEKIADPGAWGVKIILESLQV